MGSGAQIEGHKRGYYLFEEAARVSCHHLTGEYDSDEWAQDIVGPNYSLATNRANLFSNVTNAHRVLIRNDQLITVKWNTSAGAAVTVYPGEYFEEAKLEVHDILIETFAALTNLKVYLT